ncbi:hypothetical protein T11_16253, partial [Trichinella zimbabwensis]
LHNLLSHLIRALRLHLGLHFIAILSVKHVGGQL